MKWNKSTLIGGALALVGLSIVFNLVLGIHLPVIRLGIACAVIYVGIRLARGQPLWGVPPGATTAFKDAVFRVEGEVTEKQSFGIACGSGVLDLSTATPGGAGDADIECGVILGYAKIYYSQQAPLEISVRTVGGDARLPDGNSAFVGTLTYRTPAAVSSERRVRLVLTIFCGSADFLEGSLPEEPAAEPKPDEAKT
jgi:hypothetical protein